MLQDPQGVSDLVLIRPDFGRRYPIRRRKKPAPFSLFSFEILSSNIFSPDFSGRGASPFPEHFRQCLGTRGECSTPLPAGRRPSSSFSPTIPILYLCPYLSLLSEKEEAACLIRLTYLTGWAGTLMNFGGSHVRPSQLRAEFRERVDINGYVHPVCLKTYRRSCLV